MFCRGSAWVQSGSAEVHPPRGHDPGKKKTLSALLITEEEKSLTVTFTLFMMTYLRRGPTSKLVNRIALLSGLCSIHYALAHYLQGRGSRRSSRPTACWPCILGLLVPRSCERGGEGKSQNRPRAPSLGIGPRRTEDTLGRLEMSGHRALPRCLPSAYKRERLTYSHRRPVSQGPVFHPRPLIRAPHSAA